VPVTPSRTRPRQSALARGLALIEILVVMAIIAIVSGAVIAGSGQLASARLRHSSVLIVSAVRVAYSRASATSKSMRLVFDFEASELWLEEGDQPMLVQSKDTSAAGGAEAVTDAEKAAVQESSRIVKGPQAPKARFREIDPSGIAASQAGKGHKKLERGIKFRSIETQHDDAPRTEGRAYLYFWPGGMSERASIQLAIGDSKEDIDTTSLIVSPLTGRVKLKPGAVDLPKPEDDKEPSEREDPGGGF
jgi:general secretion pathway protein H